MNTTAITTTEAVTPEKSIQYFENGVTITEVLKFYFGMAVLYVIIIIGLVFIFKIFASNDCTDIAVGIGTIIFIIYWIYIIVYFYSEKNMGAVYVTLAPASLLLLIPLKRLIAAIAGGIAEHRKMRAFYKAQSIVDRYIKKHGYASVPDFVRYVTFERKLKKYLKYTYQKDRLGWDITLENKEAATISYMEILVSVYFVTISKVFSADLRAYVTEGNRFYENEIYKVLPKYNRFFQDEYGNVDFKIQKYLSDKVIAPLMTQNIIHRENTQKGYCYTPANGQIANLKSERKYIVDDF